MGRGVTSHPAVLPTPFLYTGGVATEWHCVGFTPPTVVVSFILPGGFAVRRYFLQWAVAVLGPTSSRLFHFSPLAVCPGCYLLQHPPCHRHLSSYLPAAHAAVNGPGDTAVIHQHVRQLERALKHRMGHESNISHLRSWQTSPRRSRSFLSLAINTVGGSGPCHCCTPLIQLLFVGAKCAHTFRSLLPRMELFGGKSGVKARFLVFL